MTIAHNKRFNLPTRPTVPASTFTGSRSEICKHAKWHVWNKGFQLVEIVVASFLFIVFAGVFMTMLFGARHGAKRQEKSSTAILSAISILEELRHNAEAYGRIEKRIPQTLENGRKWNFTFKQTKDSGLYEVEVVVTEKNENEKNTDTRVLGLVSTLPPRIRMPGYSD